MNHPNQPSCCCLITGLAWLVLIFSANTANASILNVNSGAKYKGSFGLEVQVADQQPAFVQDDSPAAEIRYRSRFYANLRSLQMSGPDEFVLFSGLNSSGEVQFEIVVRFNAALNEKRLIVRALENGGNQVETAVGNEILLEDIWNAVEIDWKVAGPGLSDGHLKVWLNGQERILAGLSGLNNDAAQVDSVRWGAAEGIDGTTMGSIRLDEFQSQRAGFIGLISVFTDVSDQGSFYWPWIHGIYNYGITSGCSPTKYCPLNATTRREMAVFLLRVKEGADFSPPACVSQVFDDVPCGDFFAPWINELAARGITQGCGGGNYCPLNSVTRREMAVFLLRTLEGSDYVPPVCIVPTFDDVPCGSPFAPWINELAARGITLGCGGGLYCPFAPVTRREMAVFLGRAFGLMIPTLP